MIRRLRVAHRLSFFLLAAVLPVGLALAVLARPAERAGLSDRVKAGELQERVLSPGTTQPSRQDFAGYAVPEQGPEANTVSFSLELAFASQVHPRDWVEITPVEDPLLPDVLIYASNAESLDLLQDTLPGEVTLVGSLNSTEPVICRLPEGVTHLLFYSLAKSRSLGAVRIADAAEEN